MVGKDAATANFDDGEDADDGAGGLASLTVSEPVCLAELA